jgi:hypothetical protein
MSLTYTKRQHNWFKNSKLFQQQKVKSFFTSRVNLIILLTLQLIVYKNDDISMLIASINMKQTLYQCLYQCLYECLYEWEKKRVEIYVCETTLIIILVFMCFFLTRVKMIYVIVLSNHLSSQRCYRYNNHMNWHEIKDTSSLNSIENKLEFVMAHNLHSKWFQLYGQEFNLKDWM